MKKKAKNLLEVKKKEAAVSDLITQTEAAELKGVSLYTLHQWIQRGRIQSVEMFGRRLVSRSEIMDFVPAKGGRPRKDGK